MAESVNVTSTMEATKQYDIDKANEDKYKRDSENKMLKEEVDSLRAKLYALQNFCDGFEKEATNA